LKRFRRHSIEKNWVADHSAFPNPEVCKSQQNQFNNISMFLKQEEEKNAGIQAGQDALSVGVLNLIFNSSGDHLPLEIPGPMYNFII